MRRRKRKQEKLPLTDEDLDISDEILEDLKQRIDNLTGTGDKQLIEEEDKIIFTTKDMTFVTLIKEEDYIKVVCELPYDRILDMSRKCEVQPYATEDRVDIVTYKVKTKFDVQYAVSIVQQSFIYRRRLKL
ncbi:MAG: hypothetical protein E7Z85_04775 [Methanosphaera stadtmanae]|nr:hypothetical protein [Methanosphaera stadtmanae]